MRLLSCYAMTEMAGIRLTGNGCPGRSRFAIVGLGAIFLPP